MGNEIVIATYSCAEMSEPIVSTLKDLGEAKTARDLKKSCKGNDSQIEISQNSALDTAYNLQIHDDAGNSRGLFFCINDSFVEAAENSSDLKSQYLIGTILRIPGTFTVPDCAAFLGIAKTK